METSITNGQPLTDVLTPQAADQLHPGADGRKRMKSARVLSIDLDLLDDNPYQPRAERDEVKLSELCESIAREGQLQPILVRRMGERWQIIFGHGRVQALRRLRETSTKQERSRFTKVRAEERTDVSDDLMVVLALVENVQREDLSPVDCAAALDRLKTMRPDLKTSRQLASVVHIEPMRVKRLLRLHAAPAIIKDAVSKGRSVLVKQIQDESDGEIGSEQQPNSSNPSAIKTRETRRLDLYSALELAKLHARWTKAAASEPASKDGTPDERMSRLIDRALQQNWSVRRIQAAIEQLSTAGEDSDADESSQSPKDAPPFKEDAKKIIIFRRRLDGSSVSQKAELRRILEPIWNILGGPPQALVVRQHEESPFSFRNWWLGMKGWVAVIQGVRKLMHLLNQPVDGPAKQAGAGAQPVSAQPSASATANTPSAATQPGTAVSTATSPTAQAPAAASPSSPKQQPTGSDVSKAA